MTNEEAIRIAQGLITDFKCESETMVEFCNVIIRALKQEPCDDCISRQAVNEGFKKYDRSSFAYGCVWGYVNKLPSVTPKEKSEYEHDHAVVKAYNDGQTYILDKIRAEIENVTSRYTISRERGTMGQVEWSDRLIKESEVLEIIDKYRGE